VRFVEEELEVQQVFLSHSQNVDDLARKPEHAKHHEART
jgi:hypothetical protein